MKIPTKLMQLRYIILSKIIKKERPSENLTSIWARASAGYNIISVLEHPHSFHYMPTELGTGSAISGVLIVIAAPLILLVIKIVLYVTC